uniref:Uncharacterized protein n=1 Tax=Meloidogyne floridensis TaxID=298350 RepID=A0A915NEG7_9BILA
VFYFITLIHLNCFKNSCEMPRIIDGVKFDFSDVLLVPKRSTLKSRSEFINGTQ